MKWVSHHSVKTYRRLLSVSKQYWPMFLLGLIGTVLLSLVDAGFAWMIKPVINQGIIHRNKVFITWLPLLVILIFLVRAVAGFISSYFISRVARHVVMDFRRLLFKKLLSLPATFYDQNSSGHLLSTIIYNVEQVAAAGSDALVNSLREATLAMGLVVVMFVVSWKLALFFTIVTPIIIWVVHWSSKRLRRLSMSVQESVGDVTHAADEGIQNFKVIRLYGGQSKEYKKFYTVTKHNQHRELKVVVTNSVGTSAVQLLIAIPIAMILFLATKASVGVTAGSFAAIVTAMVMLLRPVRRLTMMNAQIQSGVAGAESIFKVLDQDVEQECGEQILTNVRGVIEYKNVNFKYPSSSSWILKDISFTVKPGQVIAIVGRSGSGKSTLVNLLPRFYEFNSGSITIDGINIHDCQLASLREQFSMVSQSTTLFSDTIANNIAYGARSEVERDAIIQAAEAAHVMEFVARLPEGLDTLIGEDGMLLSGGQRQRIAIARALLKKAPILILDEATSALDTHSERHIQAALDHLMQQCTTLVIAHRLSTIENADWILVLDKGAIIEQGTHAQLLQRQSYYAQLHALQFQMQVTAEVV